ncbi:MAG TPA: hypothetical protein VJU18_07380 [Vicinamibacteria bacterium]|nr:hypothetical protein [Vicinamibacteria bacterium]
MTNRDVALLAFRLLGLWLVANAAIGVAGLPYYWEPQFEAVRGMTVFFTLLPLLVAVGIGVPVWFSADWFAARIFPNQSQPTALDRLRGEPLVALALSVIGVLLLCEALPVVVNGTALFTQSRFVGSSILGPDVDQQRLIWSAAAKANVTAGIARLLIGLALVAGPARLGTALARVRKELTGTLADDAATERGKGAAVEPDAPDERALGPEPPARR